MIKTLVNCSNLENLLDLRNLCTFLLAYTGFFRIEEALRICTETSVSMTIT